jgi:hypothetical protein
MAPVQQVSIITKQQAKSQLPNWWISTTKER